MKNHTGLFVLLCAILCTPPMVGAEDSLVAGFTAPPSSARARTWWHWINGNVTQAGITSDLEAMKQAGIHEAQIFNVDMGYPEGPVSYLSDYWLDLFRFAVSEAARLGMELGFHNGAGWSCSGGPWIAPQYAMQTVVYTETVCNGNRPFKGLLPQPTPRLDYYRDILVLAFPKPQSSERIDDLGLKTLSGHSFRNHQLPDSKQVPASALVPKEKVIDLTSQMTPDGMLEWDVPPGEWIVLRMGHTPTGAKNSPAPESGRGLECDKLSRQAVDIHWRGGIQPILDKLGTLAGSTMNNCIVDSYEVGCCNWTERFDESFRQLRGYDCRLFLPTLAGYYVESGEITERFLWDFRRTVGDLYVQNYYGRFKELCQQHHLQFSVEPYGGPFDCMQAGATGDVVMGEFWSGDLVFFDSPKLAASIAHINGIRYVGAEAFTSYGGFQQHPATYKSIGDKAWTEGVNRLIFHTYVHQPWNEAPGLTLGRYGLDLSRLNTWWRQSQSYNNYIARSQFLLQQGRNVADVLVFSGESSPNDALLKPSIKALGVDYDMIDVRNLMKLTVKEGRLHTPAGGEYRLLLLPKSRWMTPQTLKKIDELATAGAVIVGPRPDKSPGLEGYPQCDAEVDRMARSLWDRKVITDCSPEEALASLKLTPDLSAGTSGADLEFIHRTVAGADLYFVASPQKKSRTETVRFRVAGKQPEIWNPQTGTIAHAAVWRENNGMTEVPLPFDPEGSLFVVFRKPAGTLSHIVNAETQLEPQEQKPLPGLKIKKAEYGTFYPNGLVDVTNLLKERIKRDTLRISAGNGLTPDDPAPGSVKELRVDYETGGLRQQARAMENEQLLLTARRGERLNILNAAYGKFDRGLEGIPSSYPVADVTNRLIKEIESGRLTVPVDDRLLEGLPAPNTGDRPKELRVVYFAQEETHRRSIRQGDKISFAIPASEPELTIDGESYVWKTPAPGKLHYTTRSGTKNEISIHSLPKPVKLTGPWLLSVPTLPTVSPIKLDSLISWSLIDKPVCYFSGTANYQTSFVLPPEYLRADRSLELDLGTVCVMAEVIVNGKNLGNLWKAPFRTTLDSVVKSGINRLEIRVTNLWVNRLIGDEQVTVDWSCPPKQWPDWLVRGEKNPTQRTTFTTSNKWNRNSPLPPSGLLGPVTIRCYQHIRFDPERGRCD